MKIDSVIESINFWESKFDEMNKRIADVESSSAHILKENKLLKEEVLRLSNSLQAEKETVSDLEHYIRRECLEITGIPEEMHEDTNDIVIRVGRMIGVEIENSDISISHWLPIKQSAKETNKIIAKFVRRDKRDEFYRARKLLRNRTTRDLNLARYSENRIFINKSLSSNNKQLLKESLKIKRNMNHNNNNILFTSYLNCSQ